MLSKHEIYSVLPDTVADVDEDQEEGDQHGHPEQEESVQQRAIVTASPARDNLWLDQEADPAHDHKHGARQVHLQQGDHEPTMEQIDWIQNQPLMGMISSYGY